MNKFYDAVTLGLTGIRNRRQAISWNLKALREQSMLLEAEDMALEKSESALTEIIKSGSMAA